MHNPLTKLIVTKKDKKLILHLNSYHKLKLIKIFYPKRDIKQECDNKTREWLFSIVLHSIEFLMKKKEIEGY